MQQVMAGSPHRTYYAVKANANPALLHLIAREGLGADVGSKGELYLALRAGFPPERITFSGVGKQDDEIEYGCKHNIHAFNVESAQEIEVINTIASRVGTTAGILLRANLDIDAGGHAYVSTGKKQNKFGIPSADIPGLLRRASGLSHIHLLGIHSHIGSQITSTETFLQAARSLAHLVRNVREAGLTVQELDFGGGYGIDYHGFLSHPLLPQERPELPGFSAPALLASIIPVLASTGCRLAVQPGRSIIAQSGVLCVRVLYRKQTENKVFIIVDGGMNDLIRPSLYHAYHQIVPVTLRETPHEQVDVVGPVCESGDFFAQDRMLQTMERGDFLGVMCAGAYGFVLASNYNGRLKAAEVCVDGPAYSVVRERERFDDLQ